MEDVGVTVGKATDQLKKPGDYIVFTGVMKKGEQAEHVLVATVREDHSISFFDPQIDKQVTLKPSESWIAYPVVYP